MNDRQTSTPSQVRGDIQKGKSRDIQPGFDPALVPMETDAEAADAPMTREQSDLARRSQFAGQAERHGHYDVAMREPDSGRTVSQTGGTAALRIVVPVLVILALALAILSWLYAR